MSTFAGLYSEIFLDVGNRLIRNTAFTVYEADGTTLSTLYTDRTKATTAANPSSTDATGQGSFYADAGIHVVKCRGGTNVVEVPLDSGESSAALNTQPINAQVGTTYTPVAADAGKLVTLNNAGAITVTLPQDSAVTFPVGAWLEFLQIGVGQVTHAAGAGATVNATPGAKTRARYSRVFAQKIAANTWNLSGDLST